jgi:hypothetical protein
VIFSGEGGGWFLQGFWQKWCVERGFFVVSLWWVAGESWCVVWCFFGAENMPLFSSLFLMGVDRWGVADDWQGATRAMGRDS